MSLLTYKLEFGRRRRAYAPTSSTASHDNHEKKINSWVSSVFLYGYGAPLGGPSDHRSSTITPHIRSVSRQWSHELCIFNDTRWVIKVFYLHGYSCLVKTEFVLQIVHYRYTHPRPLNYYLLLLTGPQLQSYQGGLKESGDS